MSKGLPKNILGLGFFLTAFPGIAICILISGRPATTVRKENKAHGCHEDQNQQPYVHSTLHPLISSFLLAGCNSPSGSCHQK
jgi:hypothetical protein